MTLEDFKKFMKTEEGKDAIQAIVDEQVDGLKKKRDELLGDKKTLKDQMKAMQDQIDAINADKEKVEQEAAAKSGDINKVREQLEAKHKKDLEKIIAERDTYKNQLQSEIVDKGLTQALIKAKVKPDVMEAVVDHIKTKFKGEIVEKDGKPLAQFDGKTVEEFVAGWTQTDIGKNFVAADNNTGGGSNGANGNGKANTGMTTKKTMPRADFESLPPGDKLKISQEGVTLVD